MILSWPILLNLISHGLNQQPPDAKSLMTLLCILGDAKSLMTLLCILMFSWLTQTRIFFYHLIQSCNGISYGHIMTVPLVCIMALMQHTSACPVISTGDTCTNMSETGFSIALNVFVLDPSSPLMAPYNLGYIYQYPFRTLGVDYVGELPPSPLGNRWVLTAVCPYSGYLHAVPVPDKTAQLQLMCYFMKLSSN